MAVVHCDEPATFIKHINSLPIALLETIFKLYCKDDLELTEMVHFITNESPRDRRYIISSVCYEWLQVINNIPELWKSLHIYPATCSISSLVPILDRSHTLPLTLEISHGKRTRIWKRDEERTALQNIYPAVAPHIARCKVLKIRCVCAEDLPSIESVLSLATPGLLEVLSLTAFPYRSGGSLLSFTDIDRRISTSIPKTLKLAYKSFTNLCELTLDAWSFAKLHTFNPASWFEGNSRGTKLTIDGYASNVYPYKTSIPLLSVSCLSFLAKFLEVHISEVSIAESDDHNDEELLEATTSNPTRFHIPKLTLTEIQDHNYTTGRLIELVTLDELVVQRISISNIDIYTLPGKVTFESASEWLVEIEDLYAVRELLQQAQGLLTQISFMKRGELDDEVLTRLGVEEYCEWEDDDAVIYRGCRLCIRKKEKSTRHAT